MILIKTYSLRFLAGAFLLMTTFLGIGQELKVNFNFYSSEQLYFSEVIGSTYFPLDSFYIAKGKPLVIDIRNKPIGYYKIHFNDTNIVDVILNNEPVVELAFTDPILQNGVEVISSKENTLLWNYKYYSRNVQSLEKQVIVQRSYLLPTDSLFLSLSDKLITLTELKKGFLNQLSTDNPNTYFTKTVAAAQPPLPAKNKTEAQVHFHNVNFADPTLIRSSIFPGTMMDYLQKYTEYTEEGFQESVDYMLALANQNQEVYEYCLNYLLEVFNLVGPDIVFDYLVENYVLDGGCSDSNISEEFKSISDGYRKLMPGNKAPEFTIKDTARKEINSASFYEENSKLFVHNYTLYFFWSSQCGHCHEAIPELIKLQDSINIVAISLDTNAEDWLAYINNNILPFSHYSDLKGWDGKTHKLFKVHKTPSYYLIDKTGYIKDKPKSVSDLKRILLE